MIRLLLTRLIHHNVHIEFKICSSVLQSEYFPYEEEFDCENKYHFLLETILKITFSPLYSYDLECNACIDKKKSMVQLSLDHLLTLYQ